MSERCNCCQGTEGLTPEPTVNRPGLNALHYRVGKHATFLETMKARLTRPFLNGLQTREVNDPAIALLDAWATVADVLTFYQERIANEGYLRTATERRSVLELARLIGYRLKPGVAASVYLAFTMEAGAQGEIPAGTRAQSLPGPGELPQPFETAEKIIARAEWNELKPRTTRPQLLRKEIVEAKGFLYFKGINTGLQVNSPLLINYGITEASPQLQLYRVYRVTGVTPEPAVGRTRVRFELWNGNKYKDLTEWTDDVDKQLGDHWNQFNMVKGEKFSNLFNKVTDAIQDFFNARGELIASQTELTELEDDCKKLGVDPKKLDELSDTLKKSQSELNTKTNTLKDKQSEIKLAESGRRQIRRELDTYNGQLNREKAELKTIEERGLSPEEAKETEERRDELQVSIARLNQEIDTQGKKLEEVIVTITGLRGAIRTLESEIEALKLKISTLERLPELASKIEPLRSKVQVALTNALEQLQWVRLRMEALGYADVAIFSQWVEGQERKIKDPKAGDVKPQGPPAVLIPGRLGPLPRLGDLVRGETLMVDWQSRLVPAVGRIGNTLSRLERPFLITPSIPDEEKNLLRVSSDMLVKLVVAQKQLQEKQMYDALAGTFSPAVDPAGVFAFRVKASLFGHNALKPGDFATKDNDMSSQADGDDWKIIFDDNDKTKNKEQDNVLWLDNVYDKISTNSLLVLIDSSDPSQSKTTFARVAEIHDASRSDYKLSGKSSRIVIDQVKSYKDNPAQVEETSWQTKKFGTIRNTTVFAQAEPLELAEMPVLNALSTNQIELDMVLDGLEAGRWVIVAGERTDVGNARGVRDAELALLAQVEHKQDDNLPGDRTVTYLTFANDLTYRFRQESVAVYGNVVKATHGETRTEVLGNGNGSQELQHFDLQQKPLTYLAVATPNGAESTLETRVNDLLWHETDNLGEKGPSARAYTTRTDDDNKTTVIFGNGEYGARLPTGVENVRAKYRVGIGKPGNVSANKITLLSTRPLGVKGVTNPMQASGGADRETRDQARKNAPLGTLSLGRIISVEDYADFARTFAGIGKAQAVRLINGRQALVYLTIAGADDIPINKDSELYLNLVKALHRYGDPHQAIKVEVRDFLALFIKANIKLLPDYEWETLKPKIEARLLDKFSFERRELGQDVTRSEIVTAVQEAPGVAYVDLEILDSLSKEKVDQLANTTDVGDDTVTKDLILQPRIVVELGRLKTPGSRELAPAQIAYLRRDLKATLILNKVTAV